MIGEYLKENNEEFNANNSRDTFKILRNISCESAFWILFTK